jgi:NADPH:quinone reductase-like Zn-dependent oxidoreductase
MAAGADRVRHRVNFLQVCIVALAAFVPAASSFSLLMAEPSKHNIAGSRMRAVVRTGAGPSFTEAYAAPRAPKANSDEVLVRVMAAAINPVDYKAPKALLGPIVGLDLAGVVEAVGDGHTGALKVGDEVYGTAKGSLADLVLANAKALALKPKTASFVQAAALPTACITSLQALRDHGSLRAGGRVMIIGASGGCGTYGLQLARSMGASHIVGVCSSNNAEYVKEHGAHRVVDYRAQKFEAVFGKQAANDERFDVVYDCATNSGGGEDYKAQAIQCLKQPNGQYVAINGAVGMWLRMLTGWGQKKNQHIFFTNMNTSDLEYIASLVDGTGANPLPQLTMPICRTLPFTADGVAEVYIHTHAHTHMRTHTRTRARARTHTHTHTHTCIQGFGLLKSRRAVGKIVFEIGDTKKAS